MNIAVIGSGAYGSYTIDAILKKFPSANITLFEVGSKKIKNEDEIGYKSNLVHSTYRGLKNGRFFGLGGTTVKWGGQLLFFSRNDFSNPSPYLNDIVLLNEKYNKLVLSKFGINTLISENRISENIYIKTGIWLGYFNRNLFKYFKIGKNKNVKIISSSRVIDIVKSKDNTIEKLIYIQDGSEREASFDFYFLTAGAFESTRILLNSGLIDAKKVQFSDHLSQKIFKISGNTKIGDIDLGFKIKGSSLITRRIIGEIENLSFFANPVFNSEFPFFQNLKRILFKKEINKEIIKSIILDIPNFFKFIWCLVFKRELFVYNNEWFIYIDIENSLNSSKLEISDLLDSFYQRSLDVEFNVDPSSLILFDKAKESIRELLINNNVKFEECFSEILTEKIEDTYHPFGIISQHDSLDSFYNLFNNMLVLNTGILPRVGGINPTAAVFPIIEEFINFHLETRCR